MLAAWAEIVKAKSPPEKHGIGDRSFRKMSRGAAGAGPAHQEHSLYPKDCLGTICLWVAPLKMGRIQWVGSFPRCGRDTSVNRYYFVKKA